MAKSKELTKEERIDKEKNRLNRLFKNISKDARALNEGIIQRAAYMRVTLEDYEKDIDENGYYELFTQSEKTEPYERERPVARLYNTMNKNYQSIMKQLSDMLPKEEGKKKKDELMEFVQR